MNPDTQVELQQAATLAVGARQYVKGLVQDMIEDSMMHLESVLGGTAVSADHVYTTLGGIRALRRTLRKVDADIRKGQPQGPPSR